MSAIKISERVTRTRNFLCLKCGLQFLESEITSEDEQGFDKCPACCETDFEEIEQKEYPKDIGLCGIDEAGKPKIKREFFRQGYVFKSWDAYKNKSKEPCYVPELSDTIYTAEDFLRICNDQKDFADELFDGVDWQHPETLLEDWMQNNEWMECLKCGSLVDYGDGCDDRKCPGCGTEMEEEEWRMKEKS